MLKAEQVILNRIYVVAWSCVGDACWVYRISVGIWIYLGLAWLAGIIGTMQDALEGLISKTDPKPKVSSCQSIRVIECIYLHTFIEVFV